MAIAFVKGATSTSGTATFAAGGTATATNLLVAFATRAANADPGIPVGWTDLGSAAQGGGSAEAGRMAFKVAAGGETGVTFPNTTTACCVAEYSGCDTTSPNIGGAVGIGLQASSLSYVTVSITPTASKSALVVTCYWAASLPTWSAEAVTGTNAGVVTERLDASGVGLADSLVTSTSGAYSGSATKSGSAAVGITGIAIFQVAAVAATSLLYDPAPPMIRSL